MEFVDNYNLYIFDLDDTLYLRSVSEEYKKFYEQKIKEYFKKLISQNKTLAIVSYNANPHKILKCMEIDSFFSHICSPIVKHESELTEEDIHKDISSIVYTADGNARLIESKAIMINKLLQKTNHCKEEIIFFDDLDDNIKKVSDFGICSVLVNPQIGLIL